MDHQGQAWLDGKKMETQTGPQKDHTGKISVTILDKVNWQSENEWWSKKGRKNNYEIKQTMKEHTSRGAVWCVTHL